MTFTARFTAVASLVTIVLSTAAGCAVPASDGASSAEEETGSTSEALSVLNGTADRSATPTKGGPVPARLRVKSTIRRATTQFTCSGLKCSCSGDSDCNDMFSSGLCGDIASCDETVGVVCGCLRI